MAKRDYKRTYRYKCTITEEEFKTTREASNADDLVGLKAYYEMHPEEDDRPEHVVRQLKLKEKEQEEELKKLAELEGLQS